MPISEMDAVDLRILKELQENARLTNAELAERVHLSPSPCLRRVRLLETARVIRKYATLLDPKALGLGVSVFVEVTLAVKTVDATAKFERAVNQFSEVVECHIMTGSSDYLLRVVVPDIPSFRDFVMTRLLAVPGVASTKSSFSLGEVKYTTSLPI